MRSPISSARALNEARQCSHPGCRALRHRLYLYCEAHARTAARLGHPDAIPLHPSRWKQQRAEVEAVIKGNPGHEGLRQVRDYLQTWMAHAASGASWKGSKEVARLVAHGVTAERLLVELCACWLYLRDHQGIVPDDRAGDHALSRAVFMLAPRPRRVTGQGRPFSGTWGMRACGRHSYAPKAAPSALAFVGRHLRQTFAAFLANVVSAVEADRRLKVDPKADQRVPLRPPSAALSLPF